MRIVIIGGSGHIGSYLTGKLVRAGHKVMNISRGISKPYRKDPAWREVEHISLDRTKVEPGVFEKKVAGLDADVIVDLISFTLESTVAMVEALKDTNISHYIYCSSIWAHGKAATIPVIEEQPKFPIEEYGVQKAKSEAYLHAAFRREGFPETVIMPGHISGPGWNIVNPLGNDDYMVFNKIRHGEEVVLPNSGLETLNHVHADDVAQIFFNSITHRTAALGESFHAVGAEAITLLGYTKAMFRYFGKEENIKILPWNEWCDYTKDQNYIDRTYAHIMRSGYYSIEKAKRYLEYSPRHTILETIEESVAYMVEHQWFDKAY